MAEIDCSDHETVGLVAGVGLHRIREDVPSLGAVVGNMILGDGGGGHPAATIDPSWAIQSYLLRWTETLADRTQYILGSVCAGLGVPGVPTADALDEWMCEALDHQVCTDFGSDDCGSAVHIPYGFQPQQWGGDTWHAFIERASCSHGWAKAYDRTTDSSIEHWILHAVGEWVLLCAPDLLDGHVRDDARATLDAVIEQVREYPFMTAVAGMPAGHR